MIKGVIFDMDGVMIDSERQSNEGWKHSIESQGETISTELVDSFKGTTAERACRLFDECYHGEIDFWKSRELRTEYVYKLRETEGIPVKPGLYVLLNAIKERGLKCAVATSTRRESAFKTLHEIGAYSYLDGVKFGDEIEHGKPEPDIFLAAAEMIGVKPSQCIVIEDSINGIIAGHAAGMKVVHVPDTVIIPQEIRKLTSCVLERLDDVVYIIDYWNGKGIGVNRKRVLDTFGKYASVYNDKDPKIKLKIDHTYRVAALCERIAESIGLSKEEKDIAWLMGVFHDIGRFEQIRRYGTFNDAQSVDHAKLSADILFRDGMIENFIPGIMNLKGQAVWDIMENAVRYHSAYRLPEGLDEKAVMYCNILRDADKVDILKVNVDFPLTDIYNTTLEVLKSNEISKEVMESFDEEHAVLRALKKTPVDNIVGHISLVYELVYQESIKAVVQQGYLDKLMAFESDNETAKDQFQHIREKMHRYIQRRCTGIFGEDARTKD